MLPGDGPADPPTMSDGEIIARLTHDNATLHASCKDMMSAWEAYLLHPDEICWDIESLIQDASAAIDLAEPKGE